MDQKKVNLAIESICNTGCTSVSAIIHTLESGNIVNGVESFSAAEINLLKNELKSIMVVYDNEN